MYGQDPQFAAAVFFLVMICLGIALFIEWFMDQK